MKTIDLNQLKPGRIASWVYVADEATFSDSFRKGGRAGVEPNPLWGDVSKRTVYSGQVATHQMYVNAWNKRNPGQSYTPDPTRKPTFKPLPIPSEDSSTVVENLASGLPQVRILNHHTGKVEYFVKGQPATPEQLAIIQSYLPTKQERKETNVPIMFPYVSNLANVIDPETV
jgi:hypothetical protein